MSKIEEIETQIQSLGTGSEAGVDRVDLLNQLARQLGIDEPRRALEISEEAHNLAEELGYQKGLAYSKLSLGFAHTMISSYDEALPMFDKLDDKGGRAQNLGTLAQVQLSMGDYDKALGNAFDSLKIHQALGNRRDEAWTINGIATGYHEIGDHERSLKYHRRSLKIFLELGERVGEARALSGIGTVYQTLCDYEEAAQYHQQSLEIFEETGNRIGEARALNDLGAIYQNVEEYDQARDFHLKSLRIRREIGSRQAESTSLLNLGTLSTEEGKLDEAFEKLHDALRIAQEVKTKPRIFQCHQALSRAYELEGDPAQALKHHQEFHRIKEEVTGEEAVARVKNLQISFAVEKSEHETEIARLKNVELKEKNERLQELLDELRATQSQLVQSEKSAALGGIVAGGVHELNTPLGVITSATDLAAKCTQDIVEALRSSESIEKIRDSQALQASLEGLRDNSRATDLAIARIQKVVGSLKSFARLDGAVFEQVDVHEGIETTLTLLENRLQGRIGVVREFGQLPLVPCYPSEMNQVFMNLLTNAIHAIEGRGRITISTRRTGGKVELEFSDTGVGIPADRIGHLFDPTFTRTGSRVKASLGLVACYNIIQKHSGEISVSSEIGLGTTFTLILPLGLQMWPQIT